MKPIEIYPAIDLKDGACVRLRRGDLSDATVFAEDPAEQARRWEEAGFEWLHVVDLNGAFAGRSVNEAAVLAILSSVSIPVQLGGGIRDLGSVERWLEAGVRRVILGSSAARDPALVREACRAFPGRICVGIDSRDGYVAVEGWAETTGMRALDLALAFEEAGAAAIVFTDISRDGMLSGLNLEATEDLAWALTTPVIASGGVAHVKDIMAVRARAEAGIAGVIVGRALYDGRITPAEALHAARG